MNQHDEGPRESPEERPAQQAKSQAQPATPVPYSPSIQSFRTFDQITSSHGPGRRDHNIAAVYFYSILDCLVEMSFAVSQDFYSRPQLYTKNLDNVDRLTELNARYGTEESFLSKKQRAAIYNGLFGMQAGDSGDAQGGFSSRRDDLMGACAAFSERVFDTGEDMLRERVRSSVRLFQECLDGFTGQSLTRSRQLLVNLANETSYPILRTEGVASVFGVAEPPGRQWPYVLDSNGGKLVAELTKQLANRDGPDDERMPEIMPMTREQFTNIQRVALTGTEALIAIIDYDEDQDKQIAQLNALSNRLILTSYSWAAALNRLEGPIAGPLRLMHPL